MTFYIEMYMYVRILSYWTITNTLYIVHNLTNVEVTVLWLTIFSLQNKVACITTTNLWSNKKSRDNNRRDAPYIYIQTTAFYEKLWECILSVHIPTFLLFMYFLILYHPYIHMQFFILMQLLLSNHLSCKYSAWVVNNVNIGRRRKFSLGGGGGQSITIQWQIQTF